MGSLGVLSLCAVASALSFSTLATICHVDGVRKAVLQPEPCQLYAPGLVGAALPSVVSVRPPSLVWWSVHLLLVSEGIPSACVALSRNTTDVHAQLFSVNRGEHRIDSGILSGNLVTNDWVHLHVEIVNKQNIRISSKEKKINLNMGIFSASSNLSLVVNAEKSYKTKFKCPSTCNIEEVPNSSELRLFKQFDKSVSFSIMSESHLTELQVNVVQILCLREMEDTQNINIPSSRVNSGATIALSYTSDKLVTVHIDGEQYTSYRLTKPCHTFSRFDVYTRGSARISEHCELFLPSITSLSPSSLMFTTSKLSSSGTNYNASVTRKASIFKPSEEHLHRVLLVVNVTVLVVEVIISLLMFTLVYRATKS